MYARAGATTLPKCKLAPVIRRGTAADLDEIAAIQAAAPEAAQWPPAEYAGYDFRVAVVDDQVAGFLVVRTLAPGESEILNLAVAPEVRRRSVGRALLQAFLHEVQGTVFLEVRTSNDAAQKFYKAMGFCELGARPQYYESPSESAIVMKFHSC